MSSHLTKSCTSFWHLTNPGCHFWQTQNQFLSSIHRPAPLVTPNHATCPIKMGKKRHLKQKVTGPFFNLPPLFLLWLRHGVPQGATKTRPARVNLLRQHTVLPGPKVRQVSKPMHRIPRAVGGQEAYKARIWPWDFAKRLAWGVVCLMKWKRWQSQTHRRQGNDHHYSYPHHTWRPDQAHSMQPV